MRIERESPSTAAGNRQESLETTARGGDVLGFVTVTAHDAARAPLRNISISRSSGQFGVRARSALRTGRGELLRGGHRNEAAANDETRKRSFSPENSLPAFLGISARDSWAKCGTTHSMQVTERTTRNNDRDGGKMQQYATGYSSSSSAASSRAASTIADATAAYRQLVVAQRREWDNSLRSRSRIPSWEIRRPPRTASFSRTLIFSRAWRTRRSTDPKKKANENEFPSA